MLLYTLSAILCFTRKLGNPTSGTLSFRVCLIVSIVSYCTNYVFLFHFGNNKTLDYFVVAALSLALGVIIYISAVNDEVAHRKKTETPAGDQVFTYRYGWAFFFGAATFMCAMVAAVSNISLHLRRLAAAAAAASAAADEPPPAGAFTVPGYRPVQPSRTQEIVAEHEVTTMNNNVTIIL